MSSESKELSQKDIEKIRAARNEYHRAWKAKNPAKVKAINERYWLKKFAEAEALRVKNM